MARSMTNVIDKPDQIDGLDRLNGWMDTVYRSGLIFGCMDGLSGPHKYVDWLEWIDGP